MNMTFLLVRKEWEQVSSKITSVFQRNGGVRLPQTQTGDLSNHFPLNPLVHQASVPLKHSGWRFSSENAQVLNMNFAEQ